MPINRSCGGTRTAWCSRSTRRRTRRGSILSLAERLAKYGGGGTDCSLPLAQANGKYAKRPFAGCVLVSDNESWVGAGRYGSFPSQRSISKGVILPPNAAVYLEAMCAGSNVVERFEFGEIGRIAPPRDRRLGVIEGENVFFALKVVDHQMERCGRILGITEHIRPQPAGTQTAAGRRGAWSRYICHA